MNDAAPDEISVGSFVCMKEDMTTTSYDIMNDENAEKEMENDNDEEGMHRRAGLAPSSQTFTLTCTIMPKESA